MKASNQASSRSSSVFGKLFARGAVLVLLLCISNVSWATHYPSQGQAYLGCLDTVQKYNNDPSAYWQKNAICTYHANMGGNPGYLCTGDNVVAHITNQQCNGGSFQIQPFFTFSANKTCAAQAPTGSGSQGPATLTCQAGCEVGVPATGAASATGRVCSGTSAVPALAKTNCCSEQSASTAGNPINFHTGAKIESATDYPGVGGRLEFSRYYTSASGLDPVTLMGATWRHTYMRKIVTVDAETVKVTRPSGDAYTYRKRFGEWMRDPDVAYRLEQVNSGGVPAGWILRAPDDSEELFDAAGLLIAVTWTDGEVLSLVYGAGLLTTVTDASGRSLAFAYNNGKVSGVSLPDGNALAYTYDPSDRLVKVELDSAGSISQISRYGYTNSAFPQALTERRDESDAVYATWQYDASGRAVSSAHGDPSGNVDRVTFAYGTSSTVVTDSLGNASTVGKTILHGRAKSTAFSAVCPSCNGQTFANQTYDINGYPDLLVDFKGVVTDRDYSPEGLIVKEVEAQNDATAKRTTETTWHAAFRKPTQRDTRDHTGALIQRKSWSYNSRGQTVSSTTTDPATSVTRTVHSTYCEASEVSANTCPREGLLTTVDGPLAGTGDRTSYIYYMSDEPNCSSAPAQCKYRKGDLWKVVNGLGQATEILAYDGAGRILSTKDVNGVTTDSEYGPRGWLTATKMRGPDDSSESDDVISRMGYWPTGQIKRMTLPGGLYIDYVYDQAHRLISMTDSAGNSVHYTLDNAGNRIAETTRDGSGAVVRSLGREFNAKGQLQENTDSQGVAVGFTYDDNGNIDSISDPLGRVDENTHDALNRTVRNLKDAGGIAAESTYAYDALDNLTGVTDPKGLSTVYRYNGMGDLVELSSPDTGLTSYSYDASGNRAARTDARGVTETYSYDSLGRRVGTVYPDVSLAKSYTYDTTQNVCGVAEGYSVGRLTRMDDASGHTQYCYDRFGRLVRKVQTTNGVQLSLQYSWTIAGQLSGMVYPDGTVVDYERNALGQITAMGVTRPGQTRVTLLDQATYLPFGALSGWTFGNGRTLVRTFDNDYRVTTVEESGADGISLSLGYDIAGNVVQVGDAGSLSAPHSRFDYDALGRLTATRDGASQTAIDTYSYDATGNRLSQVTAAGVSAYSYAGANHHLLGVDGTTRSYDAVGNLTAIGGLREFVYDDGNRMSQVKQGASVVMNYTYNGSGEQVRRSIGSSNTYTMYDEEGRWLGDYDGSGIALQQVLWMDDLPVGLSASGGRLHYIEADHIGTPRVVIDVVRNVAVWKWDLKGEAFGSSAPEEDVDLDGVPFVFSMRFPGQRFDVASGLHQNYFRDYDAETGRYSQSDPIGLKGGVSTYGYVNSAPTRLIDPSGLLAFTKCSSSMIVNLSAAILQMSNTIIGLAQGGASECKNGPCNLALAGKVMKQVSGAGISCNYSLENGLSSSRNGYIYLSGKFANHPNDPVISSGTHESGAGCLMSALYHEAMHIEEWHMAENDVRRETRKCFSCALDHTEGNKSQQVPLW